jgi:hypothetical protein
MRKRSRPHCFTGCFVVVALLWGLCIFLLLAFGPERRISTLYGPDAYYEVWPFYLFMIGLLVLYVMKSIVEGIWNWLGKEASDEDADIEDQTSDIRHI